MTAGETAPSPLDQTVAAFTSWLYLPDLTPLYATLGAVAANQLEGDPVWLLIVAPPGGTKTEILQSCSRLPFTQMASTITVASLLSGVAPKERARNARGGLLREIGSFGVLILKDYTSILSMNRDARAEVLAALREIYDGVWVRHVGTGGGQTLAWEGKLGLVAGCTDEIEKHYGAMAMMGERFLQVRANVTDRQEQARRALSHGRREKQMRDELAAAVTALLDGQLCEPRDLTPAETERLIGLAETITRARSAVLRDSYGAREVLLVPDAEAPTRFAKTLRQLLDGLDAIGTPRPLAWQVVNRVALDSIPKIRRAILALLLQNPAGLSGKAAASLLGLPRTTVGRELEELRAHTLITRSNDEDGWHLTTRDRTVLRAAEGCPETSPDSPSTSPNSTFDDISGHPPDEDLAWR